MRASQILLVSFCLALLSSPVPSTEAQDSRNTRKVWRAFHDEIRVALRRGSISEQRLILEQFADQDYPEASEYLFDWIKKNTSSSPATARKAAEVLGMHRNEKAIQLVSESVRKDPAGNRHLLRSFFAHNPPDVSAVAFSAIKAGDNPAIRALAIPVAAGMKPVDPTLIQGLVLFLKPRHPAILRRASVEALGRISSRDSIPALIEMLGDPLLEELARDALLRLTGEGHWSEVEAWKSWWDTASTKEDYLPSPLSDELFDEKRVELSLANGDDLGGEFSASFYGRKIEGKSILFLLDASQSMEKDGRIERLRQEFETMFLELSPKRRFGIILFPHDVFPNGSLVPATEENKRKAVQFVKFISPNGRTPMMSAFKYVFEKIVAKENVDTIYLLSDGEPTDYPAHRVHERVLEYNGPLGVRIHTIWLGGKGQQLLEFIAKESGGTSWSAD